MAMTQPPSKSQIWHEKDELCLLSTVLEIAREPAKSYDPRINLFDRIGKSLMKAFTNKEVLGKVNELKARYERKRRLIRVGYAAVKRTAAFKISEKIWGDEEEKKAAKRTSEDGKKCHGQKVEHLKATKLKSTACSPKTNPHEEASRPNLKRAHEPTKKRDGAGPKKRWRGKRGNPSNKKQENKVVCFNCGKPGHYANYCHEKKKFEKNPGNQKETEELQPGTENKCEEQSCTPISASFQPGSHQIKPQQTQQRAEGHNSPQPSVHRISPQKTQQRVESYDSPQPDAYGFIPQAQQRAQGPNRLNSPQPGAHQLQSDQNGVNVSNSFQPYAHRPTFEQTNVVNRFQDERSPQHWNRGPPLPPISPPPATWAPRPPIATPFPPPPPQMPYRHPPPYRMNYTLPPNYNNHPTTNFNQSPAAPNYPMFNPTFPSPTTNFSPSPPPPNYPVFNAVNPPITNFYPPPAENPAQFPSRH